jgi:DNA mismatch endonuclease, patch repair protein
MIVPKRSGIKAPRFDRYHPVSATTSKIKQKNRSRNTRHEHLLRIELLKLGVSFKTNASKLVGKPDIVLKDAAVAVFCDGDFWHGKNWRIRRKKLLKGANSRYWHAKILANRQRDKRNTSVLRRQGWTVLRFWESEIVKAPATIARKISTAAKRSTDRR